MHAFMCVSVGMDMPQEVCADQRKLERWSLPSILLESFSFAAPCASQLLLSLPCVSSQEHQDYRPLPTLPSHMGSGDLNSGPRACAAGPLSTEPPLNDFLLCGTLLYPHVLEGTNGE